MQYSFSIMLQIEELLHTFFVSSFLVNGLNDHRLFVSRLRGKKKEKKHQIYFMQNLAHKLMTDELHYNIRTPVNR